MAANLADRVRKEGMDYGMFEAAASAAAWLHDQAPAPARIRVVGDDDSDGVTSAHILSTALRRAEHTVETHLQPIHTEADLDRALAGRFDAWLVADAGSTFLRSIDRRGQPVLIVDHHAVSGHEPTSSFELNPRRAGGNRTWGVSASTVSALFALALDGRRNWDLAPAGIAGAISDRQHLGGYHGLTAYLAEGAARRKLLSKTEGFTLDGPSVRDALHWSLDPYVPEFADDAAAVDRFLRPLKVEPGADPLTLEPAAARRLADALQQRLDRGAARADRIHPLHGARLHLPNGPAATVTMLSKLLEAATAEGAFALALALLAHRPEAPEEAWIVWRNRQRRLLDEARRLRGTVQERAMFRWARTDDAANTGVYSHLLLTYVHGDAKPLLVFAPTPHGSKVSARGSSRLYLAGQDLAAALSQAAQACGGTGGGHPGAAGATIPEGAQERFSDALDAALAALAKKEAAA